MSVLTLEATINWCIESVDLRGDNNKRVYRKCLTEKTTVHEREKQCKSLLNHIGEKTNGNGRIERNRMSEGVRVRVRCG